jgi:hypothetical protein
MATELLRRRQMGAKAKSGHCSGDYYAVASDDVMRAIAATA